MKHLLITLALGTMVALQGWADTLTVDGYTFSTSGTDATVTAGPVTGDLVIPSTFTSGGTTYTVKYIANKAFYNQSGITSVIFPNTLISTGSSCFENCSNMTKLDLGTSIETIGQSCFDGCVGITSVTFPSSLKKMVGYSFYGAGLTQAIVPEGVEYIGNYNFCNCKKLTSISLPSTLTTFGSGVLTGCESLAEIQIADGCKILAAQDGMLFNADKTLIKMCPVKKTGSVTLPASCIAADEYAFNGCSLLTSVTLPDGFLTLNWAAFKDCSGLTELNLGKSLTYVGRECFQGCSSLKTLVLPETVATIDDYSCFAGMTSLEGLVLPDNVVGQLGNNVFRGDTSLKKLTIGKRISGFGTNCFDNLTALEELNLRPVTPPTVADNNPGFSQENYNTVKVVVPSEALGAYVAAEPWKNFVNLQGDAPVSGNNSASILALANPQRMAWSEVVGLVFKVRNEGKNTITSLGGILTIDGETYPEQTISNLNIPSGGVVEVTLPLQLNIAKYEMELQITKVNGEANESTAPAFKFNIEIVDGNIPADSPEATYANFTDETEIGMRGAHSFIGAVNFKDPNLAGCKVIGAKVIGLPKNDIENVKIWSSTALSFKPNQEVNDVQWDGTTAYAKYFDPITLTADGAYFGLSMDLKNGNTNYWPFPVCSPANVTGGFFMSYDGNSFEDMKSYGTLQIILILDKEGFTGNRLMAVGPKGINATTVGTGMDIPVEIVNYTGKEVANIHYTYTGDGKSHEGTITTPVSAYATVKQQVKLPVDAIDQAGNYTLNVSLDQVNGEANVMEAKTLTIPFSVAQFKPKHLPFMEEMTGTGCGWCPRGMLGMAELNKTYPEFIGAAYHRYNSSDPMYPTLMGPFKSNGAPNSIFDRMLFDVDPFFGTNGQSMGVAADYESQRDLLAPANIGIRSSWNADMTQATVEADVEFAYVGQGETYKIGYIFTIDSVHGNTAGWRQSNNYAGESYSNPLIQTLCDGTFNLSVFNHVVIDGSAWNGVYSCTNAQAGSKFSHSRTFSVDKPTLSDGSWLTDPANCDLNKVNAIVLLIDNNRRVRNARMVRIGQEASIPTAVNELAVDSNELPVYYDLMGRRVANPRHGIFIKIQAGKTTKVAL